MSLIFKGGKCPLCEEARARVRIHGQKGRRIPHLFSSLYHGQAMAKHIKASFRSPVWSVRSCLFSSCVDSQPTVWTVREHQACRSKEAATFSNFRRKGRGRVEWAGGRCREGIGHLGIFVRNMKEHLCWGACSALRIDCVLHVFTGDVWIFD